MPYVCYIDDCTHTDTHRYIMCLCVCVSQLCGSQFQVTVYCCREVKVKRNLEALIYITCPPESREQLMQGCQYSTYSLLFIQSRTQAIK